MRDLRFERIKLFLESSIIRCPHIKILYAASMSRLNSHLMQYNNSSRQSKSMVIIGFQHRKENGSSASMSLSRVSYL